VIVDGDVDGPEGGFTLCREIVEAPLPAQAPVIVMTKPNDPDQVRKAAAAGAAAHMPKPIKAALLEGAIATAVFGRGRYQELRKDLGAAETYVRSLIPEPVDEPLKIDWRYVPANELAGDALGFHWIDDDHCAFYVLDASGHGIDACLQSVSVLDALKSQSLPDTDFRQPEQVLRQLNLKFPMESHDDRCFTIWYGVYDRSTSTLAWSGGGHPPALLLRPNNDRFQVTELSSTGPMVGMLPDSDFPSKVYDVQAGSQLYVYSDGVFEIESPDGSLWTLDEFVTFVGNKSPNGSRLEMLWRQANDLHGQQTLDDDFTVIEVTF
jgi:sigma-B regulation protein RsbU (phosphoserine phosphatase)